MSSKLIYQNMYGNMYEIYNHILEGLRDIEEGRYIKGTGDFDKDMEIFEKRQEDSLKERVLSSLKEIKSGNFDRYDRDSFKKEVLSMVDEIKKTR